MSKGLLQTLSEIGSQETVTGETLLEELLGESGLRYLSMVDSQNSEYVDESVYRLRLMCEGDAVVEYIQLDNPAELSRSEFRSTLRRDKQSYGPAFLIITEAREGDTDTTGRKSPIKQEFDLVRLEPTADGVNNIKYFTLDLGNIEPVYYEILDDLRFGGSDDVRDVRARAKDVFQMEEVTNKFYREFSDVLHNDLIPAIDVCDSSVDVDKGAYARLVVNRVLFLMFIQEKGWLDGNNTYIQDQYEMFKSSEDDVYTDFFQPLFFDTLCNSDTDTDHLGRIPYFNSGLFRPKKFNTESGTVAEPDAINIDSHFFETLLSDDADSPGLFRRYRISIRETNPTEQELVIDPEFVGRVFEAFMNDEERSEKGAFYTPKPVTQYMAKNSIAKHLFKCVDSQPAVLDLVQYYDDSGLSDEELDVITEELKTMNIVDPAVGSGAFSIAMLDEIYNILVNIAQYPDKFQLKKDIAQNLYGVDIDSGGIELCKFRIWLSLIKELDINNEEFIENNKKYTLPNLNLNFVVGNSLVGDSHPATVGEQPTFQETLEGGLSETLENIAVYRDTYYDEHDNRRRVLEQFNDAKDTLKTQIDLSEHHMDAVIDEVPKEFMWSLEFPEVIFSGGFDIVIGNPPYEGQSKSDYISDLSHYYDSQYEFYKTIPRMKHDLYQKFIIRGWEIAKESGVVSYITSRTFLKIASKETTRHLMQSNRLTDMIICDKDVFKEPSVKPAIFTMKKGNYRDSEYEFNFVNAENIKIDSYPHIMDYVYNRDPENGPDIEIYRPEITSYRNSLRRAFFEPTKHNLSLQDNHMEHAAMTSNKWEDALMDSTSKESSLEEIKSYLSNLSPGDTTILGLVAKQGQGSTPSPYSQNMAVLENTEKASRIKERNDDFELNSQNKNGVGQAGLNRVIRSEDIIHGEELSQEEMIEGISCSPFWVPVERGFGKSDTYYKPTPEYINWSQENVRNLMDSNSASMKNLNYNFRRGVFVNMGGFATLGARYTNGRFICKGTILIPINEDIVSSKYLTGLLNSKKIKDIIRVFINGSGISTNDPEYIPVVVPTNQEKEEMEQLVEQAISARKGDDVERSIQEIQEEVDNLVEDLYG